MHHDIEEVIGYGSSTLLIDLMTNVYPSDARLSEASSEDAQLSRK